MKFIVTGGAGFIGHNVVRQLEAQGHECFVIDSVTDYGFIPKEELTYLNKGRRKRMRSTVHHIDLRDHAGVESIFQTFGYKIDAVIHLASFPRQKVVADNPIIGSEVMSTALINLLELTYKYRIPKFVYVSSSMVYGDFANNVSEDASCSPIGQYGIMKYMGEKLVEDYTRRGLFDHVIVRPSAVYGEWDVDDRVVSKFMLAAINNDILKVKGANEVLDFTHVEDAATGIVLAATKEEAVNNTYNITRSDIRLHTLLDAASLIIKTVGQGKIDIQDKDSNFPSRGRLRTTKAVNELGFNPTINIEEGFKRYYEWFRDSIYWSNQTVSKS